MHQWHHGFQVTTLLSVFLVLCQVPSVQAQSPNGSVFDWHWGPWRLQVIGNRVVVRRHHAPLLVLRPPSESAFLRGQWQGAVVTLEFQSDRGTGQWVLGALPNGLSVVAQLPPSSDATWRWVLVNPNLLQGTVSRLSSEDWIGRTIFGTVALSVGGATAQTRWRLTEEGWQAELSFPKGTPLWQAQLELRVPSHWLVSEPADGEPITHPMDIVQGSYWDLPLVPRPQWWRWGDTPFRFGRQVLVLVGDEAFQKAAEHLKTYLQQQWLRQVTVRPWVPPYSTERAIIFAPHQGPLREKAAALEPRLKADLPPEGYALAVSFEGIWILANEEAGAFWAVQTLKQLLRLTNDGALIVPGIFVHDFPDFPFRGIHFVLDNYSPEFHSQMIESVWAPLKFNKLVMQVDHLKWEQFPELWQPWSVAKEDVRALVQKARTHFMEVIPLLPTLSHCEYLFGTPAGQPARANAEIAEDPETAYTYCPTLERTYQVIFSLLNEVLGLFQPRWVHIGHDEVTNRGRFGSCLRCQGIPYHQLFAADVKRLHEFLTARGVGVMMWGDMLLRPDEASDAAHGGEPYNFWRARTMLPRDIVIVDWHYQPASQYPSVFVFRNEGFQVIGATWRNPQAIERFAKRAKQAGALGMLQTTWTGFGNNRNALRESPDQFAAYITASEWFWNTQSPPPTHSAWTVFEALWRGPLVPAAGGFVVDLSPIANLSLAKLVGIDPSHLRGAKRWWNRRLFWLAADEQENLRAVALKSVWLLGAPEEVSFPLYEQCSELTFIHATGFRAPEDALIGSYELELANGDRLTVPLRYGQQLRALTDDRLLRDERAAAAWWWNTPKGRVTLYALTVPLDGDQQIRRLRFTAIHEEAAPLLVALTGLSPVSTTVEAP